MFSLPRKTTSEFFQLSARARVLCCKNEVMLHKTYLAICYLPDANKSVPKSGAFLSRKERIYASNASAHRLGAKLLSVVSNHLPLTEPQIRKSTPQVRTKENHADYSVTEPYICIVKYVGGSMRFR